MKQNLDILVLEPFGGGSHAALYRGWQEYSQHRFTILELPAVHWKWRSRHSSLTLALQANELIENGARFDVVFCSDMLNVPEWRGFAMASLRKLPTIIYFHENQFTYPLAAGQSRDYHFAYNNVLSIIVADQAWFNSDYHRREFATAAHAWLRRMPDYKHCDRFDAAIAKSLVMPPGIAPPDQMRERSSPQSKIPTIGWVARWEHDKRPDLFAGVIGELIAREVEFRLILLGQQFASQPDSLKRILQLAGDRVLHCGFADSRDEYWQWLSQMDIVVSTADHEFFGIGIVEAIYAGAQPLLPNRLAYPEVLNVDDHPIRKNCLYESTEELVDQLESIISAREQLMPWVKPGGQGSRRDTQRLMSWVTPQEVMCFCWSELALRYDAGVKTVRANCV